MPAKHEQMRNANTLLVLDHIRQHGESTRRSIQLATELSWAAVSNISTDLISKSVLREMPFVGKLAGRNPGFLDFVPMHNLTLGLDLNAEAITVLLLDLRCGVIDSLIEPIRVADRDHVIEQLLNCVDSMIQKYELKPNSLLGIGIATQGSVDREGSMSLYNSFFRGWRDVPLKKIFEERFGIPAHVMHDPVCIALAEQWQRKLSDKDDFAMLRLSYGIGMSYVVQGNPITGCDGIAGELGHMVLNPNGPVCSCGNRGCMESYISLRGLSVRLSAAHEQGRICIPEELLELEPGSVAFMRSIVAWAAGEAREGNAVIKALFDDAAFFLGMGIANIVSLFNPEYVVLTGEMTDYDDLIMAGAKETARKMAWSLSKFDIQVSSGDRRQAAMGAGLYYINDAFNSQESRLLGQSITA